MNDVPISRQQEWLRFLRDECAWLPKQARRRAKARWVLERAKASKGAGLNAPPVSKKLDTGRTGCSTAEECHMVRHGVRSTGDVRRLIGDGLSLGR